MPTSRYRKGISITEKAKSSTSSVGVPPKIIDNAQLALDIIGLIPILGTPADLLNSAIFLLRGKYFEAFMSFVAAIPGIGLIGAGGKYISKSIKSLGKTTALGKKTKGMGLIYDKRKFETVRKNYNKARDIEKRTKGNLKTPSLDHVFISQKIVEAVKANPNIPAWAKKLIEGISNSYLNLLELPGTNPFHKTLGLNEWMGFATKWGLGQRVLSKTVRVLVSSSVPLSIINSACLRSRRIGGEFIEGYDPCSSYTWSQLFDRGNYTKRIRIAND